MILCAIISCPFTDLELFDFHWFVRVLTGTLIEALWQSRVAATDTHFSRRFPLRAWCGQAPTRSAGTDASQALFAYFFPVFSGLATFAATGFFFLTATAMSPGSRPSSVST